MSVITLTGLQPAMLRALREKAEEDKASLNETIQKLLASALELDDRPRVEGDLDRLAGTWSTEEADEFDAALAEQRQVDPGLWQ